MPTKAKLKASYLVRALKGKPFGVSYILGHIQS